jgi:Flp pilus assembly protein TadG
MLVGPMLRHFTQDRRGNVAPMFALAILPVVGFVGAAVDYSRANSIKASLQASLDATGLAMAKLAPTLTQGELQTRATTYFTAQFNKTDAKNLTITSNFTTTGGSQLTLTAAASMDTAFMKIMGYSSLNVGSSSTVKWGNNRLRVALALDNTGSMASDGKMTALKSATKNLLDQLKAAATTNGDVYVSIVPFSKDVNAGSGNYSASWINWSAWDAAHMTCNGWVNNGTCYSWSGPISFTPANHNTWNGCVTDRDKDYDITGSEPTSTLGTRFVAEEYGNCPLAAKGLSYDWTSMKSTVDQMYSSGSTNQTIGLVWAWMSLTGGGPFTVPAKDPNYQYQQTIMLMSDGLNTQNRWDGNGSAVSTAVDARMALACTNAKAAGITIYTVHVNTNGDPTSQILKNCASSPSNFFTVTSSGQINTVFNQIGTQLSQLRLSR